jgi:hypothetical protein
MGSFLMDKKVALQIPIVSQHKDNNYPVNVPNKTSKSLLKYARCFFRLDKWLPIVAGVGCRYLGKASK